MQLDLTEREVDLTRAAVKEARATQEAVIAKLRHRGQGDHPIAQAAALMSCELLRILDKLEAKA